MSVPILTPPRVPQLSSSELTGVLAASEGRGSVAFDTDLESLVVSDGAEWKSSSGSVEGQGFDTLPFGALISWSRKTFPFGYVLADGTRYTRAAHPQGYDMAVEEADSGNSDYTYRTSDETFTVPDYSNRFIYSSGAKAPGTRGGLEDVTLTTAQMPSHSHGVTDPGHSHSILLFPMGSPAGGTPAMGYATVDNYGWSNYNQMIDTRGTGISINSAGSGSSHTNMPPYVVLALLVKIAGVSVVDPTTIAGPPGAQGDTGYDTDPIGTPKAWTSDTMPEGYVLASRQASNNNGWFDKSVYPQGWAFAKAEKDAGNTLWDYNATQFRVPDLTDRFIFGKGPTNTVLGATGGARTVTLDISHIPSHHHRFDISASAVGESAGMYHRWSAGDLARGDNTFNNGTWGTDTANTGGGAAHENLPPYIVLVWIIKVAGVTASAGVIQGPPGADGVSGSPGGFTLTTVPYVKVTHTADQGVGNTSPFIVSFNTEWADTDNMFQPGVAGDKLFVNTPGLYLIDSFFHTFNPAGDRTQMTVRHFKPDGTGKNGSGSTSYDYVVLQALDEGQYELNSTGVVDARVGDYFTFEFWSQNGAGVRGNNNYSPIVSATWLGNGRGVNGIQATPVCALKHSVDQTIADNGGWTNVAFNTKVIDTDGMLDVANQITIKTPGFYSVVLDWLIAGGTGERYATIQKNGVDLGRTMLPAFANDATGAPLVVQDYFATGDVLVAKVGCYQASGSKTLIKDYLRFSAALHSGPSKAVIPHCRVRRSTNQTINNVTWTRVSLDSVQADNDSMFDAANNRVVIKTPGVYAIAAAGLWKNDGASGTGLRCLSVRKNGTSIAEMRGVGISGNWLPQNCSQVVECMVGDIIEMYVEQESGGAITWSVDADPKSELTVTKIGLSGQSGVSNSANWAVSGNDIVATNAGKVSIPNGIKTNTWVLVGSGGTAPGFQNGWGNYDAANRPVKFKKLPDGTVVLSGIPTGGTAGTPVFTLPADCWPDQQGAIVLVANVANVYCQFNANGEVRVYNTGGAGSYAYLSPVRFQAAGT